MKIEIVYYFIFHSFDLNTIFNLMHDFLKDKLIMLYLKYKNSIILTIKY